MPLTFERRARAELERRLARLVDGADRLIVGPFQSEVGPELLYWAPFARWVVERFELDPARVSVISRGGVSSWYEGVGDTYVDVFDVVDAARYAADVAVRGEGLGGQKQARLTHWDRQVLERSAHLTGWTPTTPLLHPGWMFRFFRRFWKGGLSLAQVLDHVVYRRLSSPLDDDLRERLPERYTAVGFYFRPSLPDSPENRRLVEAVVGALADRGPVVLLDTGVRVDEHERPPVDDPRALRPLVDAAPSRNLGLQSAVIAHSDALVGTYGGLTYAAPAHGVPAISFAQSMAHNLPSHLDASRRLAAAGGATLTVLPTRGIDQLAALAG
jgi:hypothetical protein